MVKLRTSEFPEGKPRSGWVRTYIDAPHRVDGMVEFSYSLHESQEAKDSRIDPFYYGSHIAMIRPPEIPHHRRRRTVDGKFIHVSKAEIAPEDMADFLDNNPAAYQWETKTPLLWTAPQGSLPPEMFPTYWGDSEPLDPQWPRESFVLDEADEIDKLLSLHDAGIEARKVSGDHQGTTLDLQVGAAVDDASEDQDGSDFNTAVADVFASTSESARKDSGWRFPSVTVSNAATIDTALLSVQANFTFNNNMNGDLNFEDVDDSANFTDTADVIDRVRTDATATVWAEDGLDDEAFNNSPEIKTHAQEVFDRGSWVSGNAVMVLATGKSDALKLAFLEDYDNDTSLAAKLHLEIAAAAITEGEIMAATSPHYDLGAFGPATMVPY